MDKFEKLSFRDNGKTFVLPVTERNAYGEPAIHLPLSDNSSIIITQKHREKDGKLYFLIRHFWPMERTSALNGWFPAGGGTYTDTCKSRSSLSRRISQMLKVLRKEGVHLRFF